MLINNQHDTLDSNNHNTIIFDCIRIDNMAHWSSSMILASGVSDPGFNSRMGPNYLIFGTDSHHYIRYVL